MKITNNSKPLTELGLGRSINIWELLSDEQKKVLGEVGRVAGQELTITPLESGWRIEVFSCHDSWSDLPILDTVISRHQDALVKPPEDSKKWDMEEDKMIEERIKKERADRKKKLKKKLKKLKKKTDKLNKEFEAIHFAQYAAINAKQSRA